MANNNFIVKNGLTVNGSFTANSTAVNASAITATSITVSGNATINAIVANGSTGLANQVLSSNGSGLYWANVAAGATFVRQTFTANATVNTIFTITNGYTVNSIDVYKNGVKLIVGTEVTANNGTSITLATPAISNTIIDVVGLLSASVYSLNINTVSQGFAFSWTNTHIFSSNVTVNSAILTVGTSTANAVVNSTAFIVANSTANAIINTTGLAVGNTTVNTNITGGQISISGVTINSTIYSATANNANNLGGAAASVYVNTSANFTVAGNINFTGTNNYFSTVYVGANTIVNTTAFFSGNSTVNAVVNSTAFTVSNSTVTFSYISPTAAQKANTTFYLNANGSWAAVAAGGSGSFNTNNNTAIAIAANTTLQTAYTAPATAGIRYVIYSVHVTNIGSANATISCNFNGSTYANISFAQSVPVPVGSSVEMLKKPKIMQPSDLLRLQASADSTLHATISYETQTGTTLFGTGIDIATAATYTDLYTATGVAVLESVLLMNDDGVYDCKARVVWTDGSNNIQGYYCYDLIIPAGATVEVLEASKALPSGYKVRVYCNVADRLEAMIAGKVAG
jgi:hypothetical protein